MSENCRICFQGTLTTPVFLDETIKGEGPVTVLEIYKDTTQLEASSKDCICRECVRELMLFHAFLLKARKSDLKFKGYNHYNHEGSEYLETNIDDKCALTLDLQRLTRDPLEETDDDEDFGEKSVSLGTHSVSNSDDEDNKPLKDLINGATDAKIRISNNRNKSTVFKCQENNDNFLADDYDTEEFDDQKNAFTENVSDIVLSAEAQIFPQGRFKCKECGKCYFTTIGLKAHIEVHTPKTATTKKKRVRGPNKIKKQSSKITNADQLNDQSNIEAQNSIEANEKTEEQATVGELETLASNDQRNVSKPRKLKLPKPKKMFPCHVCGKHMISASKLRYHMVMHTGEKDYLCTMCPKAYSTIYALKHHLRTHTGERPYECKFCGDKFTRPTTLKSHMRRHTGERPYGCDICGKRFIQHSSMTTHIKLNHMDKTIPCSHCEKKYARQTDLNTHLLSHSGNKPFSCQLCPSRFIRQANLNKHLNQHHSSTGGRSNDTKSTKTNKPRANSKTPTTTIGVNQSCASLNADNRHAELSNSDGISKTNTDVVTTNIGTLNNCQQLNSTALMPTMFAVSSAATDFVLDNNDSHLLGNMQHTTKSTTAPARSAVGTLQQQQQSSFSSDSTRSAYDLNRWNWPNHT